MYSMVVIRSINGKCKSLDLTPSADQPSRVSRVVPTTRHERDSVSSDASIRSISCARTGLVEGQQTKFYAEPVNVLAGRLGLPQWLVDLRHEATHSQERWWFRGRGPDRCMHAGHRVCTDCSYPSLPTHSSRPSRACGWARSSFSTGSSGSTGKDRYSKKVFALISNDHKSVLCCRCLGTTKIYALTTPSHTQ
jgi:hypothetical protein